MKVITTIVAKNEPDEVELADLVDPKDKRHPAQQVAVKTLNDLVSGNSAPEALIVFGDDVTEVSVKVVEDGTVMAHRIWHPGQQADQ